MTAPTPPDAVEIEAPARLHLGVLDLRGALGRRFGGIGVAIPTPSLRLTARRSDRVIVTGEEEVRGTRLADQCLRSFGVEGGVEIHIDRAIPAHSGLGSGTQLGMSVARAIAELYGIAASPATLAAATGRGARSAIGTWAFALGGFILEGGRRPGVDAVAPMLARHAMPEAWRYVLAIPDGKPGLSGEAEEAAFRTLPLPSADDVERVAHLVLMQLLPSLVEADIGGFGSALGELQQITGRWWAPEQGGSFVPGRTANLIERMRQGGAAGVGQSSWGPAAYAIVEGADRAATIAHDIRGDVGDRGVVIHGGFAEHGAVVRRIGTHVPSD